MADFTAAQLENAFNSALAYFMDKGNTLDQSIQDKPLLRLLEGSAKEFPGGNRNIERRVVGDYTTTIMGYTNDDTVTYGNPANTKVGRTGFILIIQDATGSRTITWGANWDFAGGTVPALSTPANSVDVLYYVVRSATSIFASLSKAMA